MSQIRSRFTPRTPRRAGLGGMARFNGRNSFPDEEQRAARAFARGLQPGDLVRNRLDGQTYTVEEVLSEGLRVYLVGQEGPFNPTILELVEQTNDSDSGRSP